MLISPKPTPQTMFQDALSLENDLASLLNHLLTVRSARDRADGCARLAVGAEGIERLVAEILIETAANPDSLPFRERFVEIRKLCSNRKEALRAFILRGDFAPGAIANLDSVVEITEAPFRELVDDLGWLSAIPFHEAYLRVLCYSPEVAAAIDREQVAAETERLLDASVAAFDALELAEGEDPGRATRGACEVSPGPELTEAELRRVGVTFYANGDEVTSDSAPLPPAPPPLPPPDAPAPASGASSADPPPAPAPPVEPGSGAPTREEVRRADLARATEGYGVPETEELRRVDALLRATAQAEAEAILHPRGRCSCGGEGTCAWCEICAADEEGDR